MKKWVLAVIFLLPIYYENIVQAGESLRDRAVAAEIYASIFELDGDLREIFFYETMNFNKEDGLGRSYLNAAQTKSPLAISKLKSKVNRLAVEIFKQRLEHETPHWKDLKSALFEKLCEGSVYTYDHCCFLANTYPEDYHSSLERDISPEYLFSQLDLMHKKKIDLNHVFSEKQSSAFYVLENTVDFLTQEIMARSAYQPEKEVIFYYPRIFKSSSQYLIVQVVQLPVDTESVYARKYFEQNNVREHEGWKACKFSVNNHSATIEYIPPIPLGRHIVEFKRLTKQLEYRYLGRVSIEVNEKGY